MKSEIKNGAITTGRITKEGFNKAHEAYLRGLSERLNDPSDLFVDVDYDSKGNVVFELDLEGYETSEIRFGRFKLGDILKELKGE